MLKNKAVLLILLSFIFSFVATKSIYVHAIDVPDIDIPGQTCGNADADNPEFRKCCPVAGMGRKPNFDNGIPVPGLGSLLNKVGNFIYDRIVADDTTRNRFIAKWAGMQELQCTTGTPSGPPGSCICQPVATELATSVEQIANKICGTYEEADDEEKCFQDCMVWIQQDRKRITTRVKTTCATDDSCCRKYCRDTGFVGNVKTPRGREERVNCRQCIMGTGKAAGRGQGVWTSLGCVYTDFGTLVQNNLLPWSISIAGLVAVLCIIYSAIILQTSRANPEKIKQAQERLTSCIIGLLLIIFSIFILRLIGVDILKLPGFG